MRQGDYSYLGRAPHCERNRSLESLRERQEEEQHEAEGRRNRSLSNQRGEQAREQQERLKGQKSVTNIRKM